MLLWTRTQTFHFLTAHYSFSLQTVPFLNYTPINALCFLFSGIIVCALFKQAFCYINIIYLPTPLSLKVIAYWVCTQLLHFHSKIPFHLPKLAVLLLLGARGAQGCRVH